MVTKIQKWGNSQGLRLPKQVLEDARLAVGDDVDVTARDGMIVIAPARRVRGKQSLKELVSRAGAITIGTVVRSHPTSSPTASRRILQHLLGEPQTLTVTPLLDLCDHTHLSLLDILKIPRDLQVSPIRDGERTSQFPLHTTRHSEVTSLARQQHHFLARFTNSPSAWPNAAAWIPYKLKSALKALKADAQHRCLSRNFLEFQRHGHVVLFDQCKRESQTAPPG